MKKIAITGPESTGKTTLAKQLASVYQAAYVPEFAREYIGQLERPYHYEDVLHIAEKQKALEENKVQGAPRFLFCDTDLLVIKVWLDDKFVQNPEWIESYLAEAPYDFHLLMYPDLNWEYDEQREDAQRLEALFEKFVFLLNHYNYRYSVINGKGYYRFQNACEALENFLK